MGAQQQQQQVARREAIVFVVGGGSYVEFANLQEWAARQGGGVGGAGAGGYGGAGAGGAGQGPNSRKITYGCTELLSPGEFVKMLGSLG